MKKLHLICNAHIDPLWLWSWSDGMAAGISTFSAAVELSEQFDYIFCHNESILYEAVKEHAPELFKKIKKLIKQGKWHVMGGWYLQSDCNMPESETINRCLHKGLDFFQTEFGVTPETAISFDSFGHSRGIVQILAGNGYKNYLICRPTKEEWQPDNEIFYWDGCDGSTVKVFRAGAHYNSPRGQAVSKIKEVLESSDKDVFAVLWGVGNHGGGPSKKDLTEIAELMKKSETEIIHSTPDAFFDEVKIDDKTRLNVPMQNCMPGCYTSMSHVKALYRKAESMYYSTEILATYASSVAGVEYPKTALSEAMDCILKCSFHDILPGTAVAIGEKFGINNLGKAVSILEDIRLKSYYALIKGQDKAKEGEYPIYIFNPEPVPVKTVVPCELILADQNFEDYWSLPVAYVNGEKVPVQLVRETSNINLDWVKNLKIECTLQPMCLTRISVFFEKGERPKFKTLFQDDNTVFETDGRKAVLNTQTGLLSELNFDGLDLFGEGLFSPVLYNDVPDPWMMDLANKKGYLGESQPFELMEESQVKVFIGAGENSKPCYRLEDGQVCTRAQSIFVKDSSKVVINYTFYKNRPEIDVEVGVLWNERNKVLKLEIPVKNGIPTVQGMLGREPMITDGSENVMQKWVGLAVGDKTCAIINDGLYGCSFKNGVLGISMLRGSTYAAHPIADLPVLSSDGYVPSIDLGWHEFKFRVGLYENADVDAQSFRFNRASSAINLFPIACKDKSSFGDDLRLIGKGVVLLSMNKNGNKRYMRLYNSAESQIDAEISIGANSFKLNFNGYQVKTVCYEKGKFTLCNKWQA